MFDEEIVAHLSGGLGNQLFIFAAGLAQSRRLGVPLVIDASRFSRSSEPRKYELTPFEDLAQCVIRTESPRRRLRLRRTAHAARLTPHVFRESSAVSYDEAVEAVRPGTTLFGYFQSPLYFSNVADEIFSRLTGGAPDARDQSEGADRTISVHYRRGDYTDPRVSSHHGLIGPAYVCRAVSLIRRVSGASVVSVFSDEPPVAENELRPFLPDASFVRQDGLSPLDALLQLSSSNHFVMSNSSFSWWAAWIMSHRSDGMVVAPRPWFADDTAASDLLLEDWVSLHAR